jgi:hypothetical protein
VISSDISCYDYGLSLPQIGQLKQVYLMSTDCATTFRIMAFSVTTLSMTIKNATFCMNETQQQNTQYLVSFELSIIMLMSLCQM